MSRPRFDQLPTAAKLFLVLSIVMLPIGLGLTWLGFRGIEHAKDVRRDRADDQARIAAKAIENLFARNALALRVAANGVFATSQGQAICDRTLRALTIAPAVAQHFELADPDGNPQCLAGAPVATHGLPLVAPGTIKVLVTPDGQFIIIRMGVIGGIATAFVPVAEVQAAAKTPNARFDNFIIRDAAHHQMVLVKSPVPDSRLQHSEWPIGRGQINARIGTSPERLSIADRLMLLLPVLMWIAAALISLLVVNRLLIRPLRQLDSAVRGFEPGEVELHPFDRLRVAGEIGQLRDSFAVAIERAERSEHEMAGALEGQRRLVREVHHRVKNNLQVVASLLNIHGRSAEGSEAQAAYSAIGRRVGALSVVHRNHFAEMEESRGIAVRPLLSELAAELRASAPESARKLNIDLDVDVLNTTQDVAVAIAFLVTEIVEFAMNNCPNDPVEVALRRTSELTARLTLNSTVLDPEVQDTPAKMQFERIVAGLAKQLRSTLDRKLGRYSVEIPVFPPRS